MKNMYIIFFLLLMLSCQPKEGDVKVHPGYSGKGFVVDLAARPADIEFKLTVKSAGNYAINLIGTVILIV